MPQSSIQRTFTGVASPSVSAPQADTSGGLGRQMSQMAQERRARTAEKEGRYLKYLDVSPETYISNKNTEKQAKMLEDYNNKATELLKKRGNDFKNFTTEDWVFLQQERNKLEAAQERMNTDLLKFQKVEQVMEADKNGKQNFDQDEWNAVKMQYMNTGVFPTDFTLPIKAQSFTQTLADESYKSFKGEEVGGDDVLNIKGVPHKRPYTVNISEEQAKGLIRDTILGNDAARKDLLARFSALPAEEKAKWLIDENDDKGISPTEERNGVIRWAQSNPEFIKAAQVRKYGTPTPIKQPTATRSTFDWNINIGGTHNRNAQFNVYKDQPQATTEGKFTFPDYMNLGQVSQTSETQNIPEIIVKDNNGNDVTKPFNETAAFHVVGLSPSTGQMVIELDGTSSDYSYSKGDVLVVPAQRFADLLKKKPFGIDLESLMGASKPAQSATTQKKGVYNPKTGKIEYPQ